MATAARTKENGYDFPLFKTPLRTPLRNGMLSSATLNDLASYSNNSNRNKHLKFVGATSMNDLQMCNEAITTPIRLNKLKFATPGSNQNRRALGLVNHNSHQISQAASSDDLPVSATMKDVNHPKLDEPVVLQAPAAKPCSSHPEDDLPYESNKAHSYQDTFDDLIPADERIERMMVNRTGGVNMFAYRGGIENTIRCQSPMCTRINVPTLLDMIDLFN